MTLKLLNELCQKNNIPKDVILMSDSGWECCETEMDAIWYSKEINTIVFTVEDYSRYNRGGDIPKGTKFVRIY